MCIPELEKSGADVAFVMPSHQYPLGIVMPIQRRIELLKWANAAKGRYIIEDDYDSEFRYKGKPIPALQGFEAQEKRIYTGPFSKSIAPAIRVGYIVLPNQLLKKYLMNGGVLNGAVWNVEELVVLIFIDSG